MIWDTGLKVKCKAIRDLEKHLDKMSANPDYEYRVDEAERPVNFIRKHIKQWKSPYNGQPLILQPWQQMITRALFGFFHKGTDRRVITELFLFIPRKNGKSSYAAAIAAYLFAYDRGGEGYICASEKKQADIIFNDIKAYCSTSPSLRKICDDGRGLLYNRIESKLTKSRIIPLAWTGSRGSGYNCSWAVFDELHEWRNYHLYNIIKTSMGARKNPVTLSLTTAGANNFGPAYIHHTKSKNILSGKYRDDSFLPVIFEVDAGIDYASTMAAEMANPNIGVSIQQSYIDDWRKKSIDNPYDRNTYHRYHLNRWISVAENKWFDADLIDKIKVDDDDIHNYYGQDVYVGVDLSSNTDLSAISLLFPKKNGEYFFQSLCFLPEQSVDRLKKQTSIDFDEFALDPKCYLQKTKGDSIDLKYIVSKIDEISQRHNIRHLGYDPAFAHNLSPELKNLGITHSIVRQNRNEMTIPCMELEDLIRKRKLSINAGNRLLDWCFANIALSIYDDGRRMPDKSRQSQGERIDPICALIFAIEAVRRFDLDKKEKSNNNDIYNLRPQDIPDIRKLFNI